MKPEHSEPSPLVVVADWDGVHLWVDRGTGSEAGDPGDRFDIRFTVDYPFQQQIHYQVSLPFVISAPFHLADIEARPSILPMDESAWRPLRLAKLLPADALEVPFAFSPGSPITRLPTGTVCAARHLGEHACGWQVLFSMAADDSVLMLRPINLSPRHLLHFPGDAVITIDAGAGVTLSNKEPSPARRYRILGPATGVTPSAPNPGPEHNPGPLVMAIGPRTAPPTPTEATLWKPA